MTIRKIPPSLLLKIATKTRPANITNLQQNPQLTEEFPKHFEEIISRCCIKPKIVLSWTEKPDELYIDDLSPDDAFFLLDEIMRFSGLTRAAERARERFRPEPAGQTGSFPESTSSAP